MNHTGIDILRNQADSLPEMLRPPYRNWLDRLAETGCAIPPFLIDESGAPAVLARLVASSEFAAAILLRDWGWFCSAARGGGLGPPTDGAGVLADIDRELGIRPMLRRCRNRGLIRVLWRTLAGADSLWESLEQLSALADGLITEAVHDAERSLQDRFGIPRDAAGEEIPLVILGMGKLGGRELNFSSDIDLVFLYAGDGETNGARSLSAHEYFTRLSRQIVRALDDVTEDGFVYRVDTRLRPFGESGPPVMSFTALENYLLQHGRGWERYAYIKARPIGRTSSGKAAGDLQTRIIEPFVYRQYLDYGVFESLRDMKALIESEVRKRELAGNIKLGPGGIREIEFIAQSLQLVRGGADKSLRCRELRTALERLGHDRGVGRNASRTLIDAYEFLRRFENAVQAIRDQQTHDIPAGGVDQSRLALVMGHTDWSPLISKLEALRATVSARFDEIAFRQLGENPSGRFEAQFASLWRPSTTAAEWSIWLEEEGIADADRIAAAISTFANAPILRQIDVTASKRVDRFMRTLLSELRIRPRRAEAVDRVLAVISQVARRSAYVALLNENAVVLERLVDLCEQSGYLAKEIEKYPALLDELLDPRLYTEQLSAAGMQRDLDDALRHVDDGDVENLIEALARFQRTALFRIAVSDVSGNLPIMKVSDRLTELAEIVLRNALDLAWSDLVGKHGEPGFTVGDERRMAGFGVVAYGKLGGMELSYGSDLDLVFLHDSTGSGQHTGGLRPVDNGIFFGRLVRRLVHFLTTQTSSGALYEVDTRLRPSGRSGLLVVSVEGFERYQEDNAWTWEHQALLRSRPVAGSASIARAFERIRVATLTDRVHRDNLLDDVLSMRSRMRANLDKSNAERFDLKQGEGGIGDIEFLVQYLVLRNADQAPALVFYSDNIRQLGALDATGLLPADDVARLQEIYRNYRLRSHRLALDDLPAIVDAAEFGPERALVTAIWQREMT